MAGVKDEGRDHVRTSPCFRQHDGSNARQRRQQDGGRKMAVSPSARPGCVCYMGEHAEMMASGVADASPVRED